MVQKITGSYTIFLQNIYQLHFYSRGKVIFAATFNQLQPLRRFFKILLRIFLSLILLIIIVYGLLQIPSVQTWVVGKVASNLSERLHTKVSIKRVNFRFFNQLIAEGILIEDRKKDTLLYADAIKANVTDWFIFKDHIAIKNIELKDAVINMKRTDSVWNYQFLVDYFASPKKGKGKKDVALDLKEVHLTNVKFNKIDGWIGQDMVVALKRMDLTTDSMNFNTLRFAINKLYMDEPVFWQRDYEGKDTSTASLTTILNKIPIVSAFKWNNSGAVLTLKTLEIANGKFINDKGEEALENKNQFDGQHIYFSGITGSLKNVNFYNDTLFAHLNLMAKEKSGLEIKKLESNLKFTPELMEFKNLDLRTNKSNLGDYYSMEYQTFNKDFGSFIHNVKLNAHFIEGSTLYSDDLALFGPAMKAWNRIFKIQGDAKGTIDNFSATNLKIKSGNSYIDGRISMRGLPDIKKTFIDFTSNELKTTYNEMVSIAPQLRKVTQPAISKLGNISYKGNFTGFLNDFVSYGTLQTNLGTLVTDVNMKLLNSSNAAYSGTVQTNGFQLGSFLNNSNFGIVAVNAKVKGSGFALKDLNTKVSGKISKVFFKNYTYQNITIDGEFTHKLFKGFASVQDPNIQIAGLDGELNLSASKPSFILNAGVQFIDFKALHLTPQPLQLKGDFKLDFTGSNIDNFLGTAQISNAVLINDSTRLSFDSLRLTSTLTDGIKRLTVKSNEIDAAIEGTFTILQLPNAFKVFLNRYYPTYIKAPNRAVSEQDFSFNIVTGNVEDYLHLFEPRLSGFNGATISGALGLARNELDVKADVPLFGYDGKVFKDILLLGKGTRDTLYATISVADIKINDSFHLPESTVKLTAHHDVSELSLKTRGSKTLNDAELNASVQTLADGIKIKFFPSSFVINDKKWILEKDGELTVRKKFIDANEIKFVQGEQQIVITTELDEINDNTHLVAQLKKINIEDFTPFFLSEPQLRGRVRGTATLYDPFGRTKLLFTGAADSFHLDDKYLGKVNIDAEVGFITGETKFKISSAEKDYAFTADGSLNFKDSVNNKLNIDFDAERFNINLLEPFLGTVFSQLSGIATGKLNIRNEDGRQFITGSPVINNGSLTIAYTKCKYLINQQKIIFGRDLIDLGIMKLTDTLGNTGTAQGKMYHRFFKDFSFEGMRFQTDKMMLLNTTKADNEQFYGNVIGKAVMTMSGPVTNLQMKIDGSPSSTDSSHIYLPTGETQENNVVNYIEFIQFGDEMAADIKPSKTSNLTLDMNLEANPACKIDVILNEETGDIIKGQGSGRLAIHVGTNEPMRMSGRYEISKGEYTFNFQTFIKRPFTINEGSITWNGDPLAAQIDLKAEYLAKNVDISSLVGLTTSSSGSGSGGQRTDITILSHLTGILSKPIINFEFLLPDYSELNRDYIVVKRLADFKNDENQMLNQVASLLLFNSFISNDQSLLSQQNTIALATTTIGGAISRLLTGILNKELEKATNGILSTYVDINPTLDLKAIGNQLQANIRGGIKAVLGKRVIFYAGGNFDYNNQLSILNKRSNFTPDFTLEWLLNKDGSVRVIGFRKTSVDFSTGQRVRTGIQLGYRKDINRLSDLFKSKRRMQQEADEKNRQLLKKPVE